MATPVHALTSACPRRGRVPLVLAVAAASAIAFLPAGSSSAAPAPSIAEVQAQAAALDLQVDISVEEYQQAQVALEGLQVKVTAAEADVATQQKTYEALRAQVGDVVAAAYRNSSETSGLSLITRSSDPQNYLDRATSLDQLAAQQARRLAEVTTARSRLAAAVKQAQSAVAAQQQVQQQAAAKKAGIEKDLAASQALLNGLQADQRAQLAAAQAAQAAQVDARAAAVGQQVSRSRPAAAAPAAAAPTYSGPASGAAGAAVQAAYSRLGLPYVWGAGGPSSFDCSGLTSWAWARGGVSLPHSSGAQYSSLRHVSQADIQPGDLVFFGRPVHHVGIYVGGGNMIHAPHTGDVVRIAPAFYADYVGAARP